MGIKHFFAWFSKNHKDCIRTYHTKKVVTQHIDTLALDLNGIFHTAAQKTFEYGQYSRKLVLDEEKESINVLNKRCFREVCALIDEIVRVVSPKKRLLLCVDGVAGFSKCCQQRQRRFKSSKENSNCEFDSCSITPGTLFMHHLNAYIDWHIRKSIQQRRWGSIQVIFSSEKVPSEGEHKAIRLFKSICEPSESFCIYGLDADLIMLCLGTRLDNVYVYRDNIYNKNERFLIDVSRFAEKLSKDIHTYDFIFLCFLVGNDFLPQIPGLEILNKGIEIMLDVYKDTCYPDSIVDADTLLINIPVLVRFFKGMVSVEEEALKTKYTIRHKYNHDELLEQFFYQDEQGVHCDFEQFRQEFYNRKLPQVESNTLCNEYVRGMQFVILYYIRGIPSWTWCFPFLYGPFMYDLAQTEYSIQEFNHDSPLTPFEQLLAVLPSKSKHLLPRELRPLMTTSPLKDFYPQTFDIDIAGKRAEWEGIVKLPMIDLSLLRDAYDDVKDSLSERDRKLNKTHANVVYSECKPFVFRSYYGDIVDCRVKALSLIV